MENNIIITDKEIELLKEIKQERQTQDKKITNLPIYIVEQQDKIAIHDENIFYDSLEILIDELDDYGTFSLEDIKNGKLRNTELPYYIVADLEKEETIEDMKEYLEENYYKCELFKILFTTRMVAVFLCLKEAERYLEYQKHNLRNPTISVRNIGYNNEGLLAKLLEELDKK